jgi:hypothetical protein
MQFYWRREAEPVKRIFLTVKSTIDTDNSSNTVLLFLFLWNSPNVYILVWKYTNKWRNICTFQIPPAKKNSNVVVYGSAILKTWNPTCHMYNNAQK